MGTNWQERTNTFDSEALFASVGEDGEVWVTTMDHTLECRAPGKDAFTRPAGGSFKMVDGGNKEAYGVNVYDEVYMRTGIDETHPCGVNWQQVPGRMTFVSTSEQGIVWAIDDEADIWVLKTGSITVDRPVQNEEHGWTLIEEIELIQVDVGYNA
jgi:hypothetical protein